MALMRPVANCDLIIMLNTETRPLPKCSIPCSKTGINTSDDLRWCVSISDRGYSTNEAPGLIATLGQLCSARKLLKAVR